MPPADAWLFEVPTPLGFRVRVTSAYWHVIVTIKHPSMGGREDIVQQTLREPDEIRCSRSDPLVYFCSTNPSVPGVGSVRSPSSTERRVS